MRAHYFATRRIGIDAGHRIARHGSKCRHIHGHRYEIEACCRARRLHERGEQSGMAIDFGFLKQEMMAVVDAGCDHGFIAQVTDDALLRMFAPSPGAFDGWRAALAASVERDGYAITEDTMLGAKLYVIAAPPTAEELARHWFLRLKERVAVRSEGIATLERVRVWESPNCWAEYGE